MMRLAWRPEIGQGEAAGGLESRQALRRFAPVGGVAASGAALRPPRPISHTHSADTTPENNTYRQISYGWPLPVLSRAVAMIGVMPEAKMPENW